MNRSTLIIGFITALILLALIIFTGCDRNATFKDTISFSGKTYVGHKDETTGKIVNDGPATDATISCESFPESTKTSSTGSYTLTITAVRSFAALNSDSYTIRAVSKGTDEKTITSGKPGDTITVRDLILYQHTEE
jgi:hypothetical protein